jgi:hypothetical protein
LSFSIYFVLSAALNREPLANKYYPLKILIYKLSLFNRKIVEKRRGFKIIVVQLKSNSFDGACTGAGTVAGKAGEADDCGSTQQATCP